MKIFVHFKNLSLGLPVYVCVMCAYDMDVTVGRGTHGWDVIFHLV